jgi:hypothetical protein
MANQEPILQKRKPRSGEGKGTYLRSARKIGIRPQVPYLHAQGYPKALSASG